MWLSRGEKSEPWRRAFSTSVLGRELDSLVDPVVVFDTENTFSAVSLALNVFDSMQERELEWVLCIWNCAKRHSIASGPHKLAHWSVKPPEIVNPLFVLVTFIRCLMQL